MTYKTTLTFTDRHRRFLAEKVGEGVYTSKNAAVAAALEQMIRDDEERAAMLGGLGQEIRARLQTPSDEYIEPQEAFAAARESAARSAKE